jgi:hypothetical protein
MENEDKRYLMLAWEEHKAARPELSGNVKASSIAPSKPVGLSGLGYAMSADASVASAAPSLNSVGNCGMKFRVKSRSFDRGNGNDGGGVMSNMEGNGQVKSQIDGKDDRKKKKKKKRRREGEEDDDLDDANRKRRKKKKRNKEGRNGESSMALSSGSAGHGPPMSEGSGRSGGEGKIPKLKITLSGGAPHLAATPHI